MRQWTRAAIDRYCGGCGALMAPGQPLLIITLPGVQRKRYRCVACEGPAPPDLPTDLGPRRDPFFQQRLDRLANRLPLDWLERAADSREPGEEG